MSISIEREFFPAELRLDVTLWLVTVTVSLTQWQADPTMLLAATIIFFAFVLFVSGFMRSPCNGIQVDLGFLNPPVPWVCYVCYVWIRFKYWLQFLILYKLAHMGKYCSFLCWEATLLNSILSFWEYNNALCVNMSKILGSNPFNELHKFWTLKSSTLFAVQLMTVKINGDVLSLSSLYLF